MASSIGPGKRSGVARLNWKTTSAGRSGRASEKYGTRSGARVSTTKNKSTVPGRTKRPNRSSAASSPSLLISADLLAGRHRRRRGRIGDYEAGHAVVHDAHELEAREVGERTDTNMAFAALHDLADRDADGEAAAVARGHDAIAALYARHALQQVEAKLRGVVADQDGALARALNHHRQARIDVGHEQRARAVLPHFGDTARQPLASDDGLTSGDARLAADVEQGATHIGADAIAHDARGDEGCLWPFAELREIAQAVVLVLEPARRRLPGQQPAVLLAQAGILLAERGEFLEIDDGAVGGGDRPGDRLERGARQVEGQHSGILDQDGVGLADQHGDEGGEHEQTERKALQDHTYLACDYLEIVPYRHFLPILPQQALAHDGLVHGGQDAAQLIDIFHRMSRAKRDAEQRILGHRNRQAGGLAQHGVHVGQHGAAAGKHDALVDDVGGQFGGGVLQRDLHGLDDGADRLLQALGDLTLGDHQFLRHAVHQVAALDLHRAAFAVVGRARRSDGLLDALGRTLADQQVMVAADVGDDRLVHLVAANTHGAWIHDAAQRQDRDFRRAAADVDHHRARGLGDRQAGADRGSHRLLDQPDLAGAGALGRFLNGAALDGGGAGGHADHDLRMGEGAAIVHLRDEVLDHRLGYFEVGDDAVAQRADRLDVARGTTQHHLGFFADREDLALPALRRERHDRGFVQDDAATLDVDQRVRRAQVDAHIRRK